MLWGWIGHQSAMSWRLDVWFWVDLHLMLLIASVDSFDNSLVWLSFFCKKINKEGFIDIRDIHMIRFDSHSTIGIAGELSKCSVREWIVLLRLYVGDLRTCSPCFCPSTCGIVVIGTGYSVCRCVLLSFLVYSLYDLPPLVELVMLRGSLA